MLSLKLRSAPLVLLFPSENLGLAPALLGPGLLLRSLLRLRLCASPICLFFLRELRDTEPNIERACGFAFAADLGDGPRPQTWTEKVTL